MGIAYRIKKLQPNVHPTPITLIFGLGNNANAKVKSANPSITDVREGFITKSINTSNAKKGQIFSYLFS